MSRPTPAVQDYLKAVFMASQAGAVTTRVVADRLGVSAASATNMLKRLDSLGLVRHEHYKGAALTEAGLKVALEVIRHHRLLETYLAEAMGVPWDRVHEEAEVLEHVLSEDLEDRIAELLGDPEFDPHGHPIPAKDGTMPAASDRRLWDVSDGTSVAVERVSDHEAAVLRYLGQAGIRPGTNLEVVSRGPLEGPLFVRVDGESEDVALSRELAEAVWVA
jgi:DtxR family Mn-dependent transcriptional regulator